MSLVRLYDTTLREGTQSPIARITPEVKLSIIKLLDDLGVDVVEAGFPQADRRDIDVIRRAKEIVDNAEISGFARAAKSDIDLVKESGADIVQVFIPGSDIQLKAMMSLSWSEVLDMLAEAVRYSKELGLKTYVAVTDAPRSREEILERIAEIAVRMEVEEVVLADTVGVGVPDDIEKVVELVRSKGVELVGVHLHNDLGLATCNALASIKAGAGEVQVTIGGIGERLGNTPLEEIAAIAAVKGMFKTNIRYDRLIPTIRKALELMGVKPYPLKPIIGDYAFLHVSDIHVYSSYRYPGSFEAFDPSILGGERVVRFGRLTGAKSVMYALKSRGINVNVEQARLIAREIRRRASRVDEYTLDDLVEISKNVLGGSKYDPSSSDYER